MASWANPDEGLCSECGHANSRQWILCDKCGARLPWAPPEAPKLKAHEMTPEQLAAVYGKVQPKEPFFLFLPENQLVLRALIFVILFLGLLAEAWLHLF
ncbi:MAG: zinc ribbon domain-containing protein [Abitibacteriaceae bacterium]|nr:zinc ribbon domain-containing protein [Abditibacteriaceae bacterium]